MSGPRHPGQSWDLPLLTLSRLFFGPLVKEETKPEVTLFSAPFGGGATGHGKAEWWPEKEELGHCALMLPCPTPPGYGSVPLCVEVGREVTGRLLDTACLPGA